MATNISLDEVITKFQNAELQEDEEAVLRVPREDFKVGKQEYINSC